MDKKLKGDLWNLVFSHILEPLRDGMGIEIEIEFLFKKSDVYRLLRGYWSSVFGKPLNESPRDFGKFVYAIHSEYSSDRIGWDEVCHFIEFTAQNCPKNLSGNFIKSCNEVFTKEAAAYRLVNDQIIPLTSEEEIESIGEAINSPHQYSGVRRHLEKAVRCLSDRKSPDYENSVKESISAVEALCKSITGDNKSTLGDLLKRIEKDYGMHKAFKEALSKLYGYTSDEGGIRHAMLEESKISYSDAKFMLVLCSAFVNYILGKESEKTDK